MSALVKEKLLQLMDFQKNVFKNKFHAFQMNGRYIKLLPMAKTNQETTENRFFDIVNST